MKSPLTPFVAALFGAAILVGACGDDSPGTPDAGDEPDAGDPDAMPQNGDPTAGAWSDRFGLPGLFGSGSRVEDIAVDATGRVYVGGIFTDAAGVPANNIAVWTGTDWAPLGAGLDGWVRGLAVDGDGNLWAGATSEDVGSATLNRWDGTTWTATPALDGMIRDLVVIDGGVVVVGDFTMAGTTAAPSVALWDGTDWRGVGSGATNGAASAIATTVDGFCVAGSFDLIADVAAQNAACWDGNAWSPLGIGLPGGVDVLAQSPNGTWFAGGTLTFIVDPNTGAYEAGISILTGRGDWVPFEGGIDNGWINEVRAIAFQGDDILVGGHFQAAGADDVPAMHLARWNRTTGWSELVPLANDAGVFLPQIIGTSEIVVDDDGSLWVGGLFTRAGETPAVGLTHVATDGTPSAVVGATRELLGLGGGLNGLAADADGDLVAGGYFRFAGPTLAENLAIFDGTAWTELGGGLAGTVFDVLVRADGSIAVAGDLFVEGDAAAFAVFRDGGWELPGGRVSGRGFALLEDDDGALWLGGDIASVGGAAVQNLVKLDGTSWSREGDFDDRVTALGLHEGNVVVGGMFTTPGAGIVIEDGTGWTELGGGLDGDFAYLNTLAVSPDLGIVVGGSFDGVGGEPIANFARWDGTAWQDVGGGVSGFEGFAFVSAILPYGDGLFVGGGFDTAGDVAVSNIAWFDGAAWHPLDTGLNDLSEALIVVDDVLYVGGPFTVAGGHPSSGFAAWDFRAE